MYRLKRAFVDADAATDTKFFGDYRFLPFLNHDGLITRPHARAVFDALARARIWLASVPVQYRNSHYVSLYSIRGGKNVWRLGCLRPRVVIAWRGSSRGFAIR
jgi:hypothetical protein